MRELWMFMILVGNMLSRAVKSQSTSTCDDQLKTVCIPAGGNALVPCPNLTYDEMEFRLLQDGKVIFNYSYSVHKTVLRQVRADLEVLEDTKNHTFNFRLIGVNSSRHSIYRCEAEIIFPPPKTILHNNQRILLLVEGHKCKTDCNQETIIEEVHCGFTWIWVALGVSAYALFVSIFVVVNWVKLRQTDTQSDYVNTKPSAPRGYRRKT